MPIVDNIIINYVVVLIFFYHDFFFVVGFQCVLTRSQAP